MELKITITDNPPRELLLLADESENSISDYIGRGTCCVAIRNDEILGEYILIHTRPFTAEIVNIAVTPAYQRQGIGTILIHHAIRTAREQGFRMLEIGTGDSAAGQVALYERCGFVRGGIDHDYFRRHYPSPIIENGVQLRHMVRLRMAL